MASQVLTQSKQLLHHTNDEKKQTNVLQKQKESHLNGNEIISSVKNLLILLEKDNCLVDVREGLQTFLIYVSNIIKHPLEPKYRKIRIGNANYQVRLGHLKHGQNLLICIGYEIVASKSSKNNSISKFLILPMSLYTTSVNLYILKKVRDLSVYKLDQITQRFREIPRDFESNSYQWSCAKHATEAHTIGRRPAMEDDHILVDNYCSNSKLGFFGLYDGHGGRATVDFLTCSFYLNLSHYLQLQPNVSITKALKDCYEITDKQIHRQQIYQSGATAVTIVLDKKNNYLYVANSGDTRAVLCRNGKAIRLTKDHKADDLEEAEMIRKRGGQIGRLKRVNGLLAVTRAFGDHLLKPPITVTPTINKFKIEQNDINMDSLLVIACDGVWDVMSDQEVVQYIHQTILKKSNCNHWKDVSIKVIQQCLHQTCLDIVKTSLERRSQDNISIIAVAL